VSTQIDCYNLRSANVHLLLGMARSTTTPSFDPSWLNEHCKLGISIFTTCNDVALA
jgi:hypothetical protein